MADAQPHPGSSIMDHDGVVAALLSRAGNLENIETTLDRAADSPFEIEGAGPRPVNLERVRPKLLWGLGVGIARNPPPPHLMPGWLRPLAQEFHALGR
jgi:hypothetical protein